MRGAHPGQGWQLGGILEEAVLELVVQPLLVADDEASAEEGAALAALFADVGDLVRDVGEVPVALAAAQAVGIEASHHVALPGLLEPGADKGIEVAAAIVHHGHDHVLLAGL